MYFYPALTIFKPLCVIKKKRKLNWITQKKGIINHHKETDFGTQPVRVLHNMLAYMFTQTNPTFFSELKEEIAKGKLNNKLGFIYGEEAIYTGQGYRTPRVNSSTRQIELHETFLSFLWCCTYSIYVNYLETIDFPFQNKIAGRTKYPISQNNIEIADEIFDYAKHLIIDFYEWDKEVFPNPEVYLAEKRTYIEQTNGFYTEAVKFILTHEFTHLKYHIDKIDGNTTDSCYLEYEIEADNNAIEKIKSGLSDKTTLSQSHKLAVEIGVVIGLLSMFYFKASTEAVKHPNTEDRLTNILEKLELEELHPAWGIACVGLQKWDLQFGINLIWDIKLGTYKEQYYEIISQIKKNIK